MRKWEIPYFEFWKVSQAVVRVSRVSPDPQESVLALLGLYSTISESHEKQPRRPFFNNVLCSTFMSLKCCHTEFKRVQKWLPSGGTGSVNTNKRLENVSEVQMSNISITWNLCFVVQFPCVFLYIEVTTLKWTDFRDKIDTSLQIFF